MFVLKPNLYQLLIVALLVCAGCTTSKAPDSSDLGQLRSLTRDQALQHQQNLTGIRYHALRDTALGIGARAGLYFRAQQLNKLLTRHERELDRIFNFRPLLLEDHILPPVLLEGRQILNQNSEQEIQLADRTYQIIQQAKFVTTAPTWRDYIWMEFKKPELPDASLLPKNSGESAVWRVAIGDGWQAGIQQADSIFMEKLGHIKRDFNGFILYRTLLAQHIVSKPFVAKTELGVVGGNDAMSVGEKVLRITALPQLQSNSAAWKTEVIRHE